MGARARSIDTPLPSIWAAHSLWPHSLNRLGVLWFIILDTGLQYYPMGLVAKTNTPPKGPVPEHTTHESSPLKPSRGFRIHQKKRELRQKRLTNNGGTKAPLLPKTTRWNHHVSVQGTSSSFKGTSSWTGE